MPATRARELSRGLEPTEDETDDGAGAPTGTPLPHPSDALAGDAGFTLIEILLTLVIISTVILALFTATIAIYAYSAAQRDLAIMNGALTERIEKMSGVPVSGGDENNPASSPNQYSNPEQICTNDVEARSRETTANPIGSSQAVTITMTPTHFMTLQVAPGGQTSYQRQRIDDIESPDDALAAACRQGVIFTFDVKAEYLDRESTLTIYRSWSP
jgi:prepilin-type N-terminal cleavage/methylation domain-containing protein